jgi:hypothetical protein
MTAVTGRSARAALLKAAAVPKPQPAPEPVAPKQQPPSAVPQPFPPALVVYEDPDMKPYVDGITLQRALARGIFASDYGEISFGSVFESGVAIKMPLYYVPSARIVFISVFLSEELSREIAAIESLPSMSAVEEYQESSLDAPYKRFVQWFEKHHYSTRSHLENITRVFRDVLIKKVAAKREQLDLLMQEDERKARALSKNSSGAPVPIDDIFGEQEAGETEEEEESIDTRFYNTLLGNFESEIQNLIRVLGEYVRHECMLEDDFFESELSNIEAFYGGDESGTPSLADELLPYRTVAELSKSLQPKLSVRDPAIESMIGEQIASILKLGGYGKGAVAPSSPGGAIALSRMAFV